jgi:hypothetical protein
MVAYRVKRKQTLLAVGIILVVLIGAGVATYFGAFQSVILGEEGYHPYDSLMAAGSYDREKWLFSAKPYLCNYDSCSGGTVKCGEYAPYNYVKTSASGPIIMATYPSIPNPSFTGHSYQFEGDAYEAGDSAEIRTVDLRLKDFKAEFSVLAGACGSNAYTIGGAALYTNQKTTPVANYPSGNRGAIGTTTMAGVVGYVRGPSSVELTWDDYQLGHYQVKVNGIVVQEGTVPEGQPFFFHMKANTLSCSLLSCWANPVLSNPRMRDVFDCQVGAGSVKATKTFRVPGKFSINDLSGLQSFCPTVQATHMVNGTIATSSQVYYALASGKSVTVGQNEIWQVSYVANADVIGAPVVCEQWNIDAGNCSGVVDLCGGGQTFVPGVGCFAVVNAPPKTVPLPPKVLGQTLYWSSYGYDGGDGLQSAKLVLMSGQNDFMVTEPVVIDEQSCPFKYEVQEYPGLSRGCFSVRAFGKKFYDGDTRAVSSRLNVTLQNLEVRYVKNHATSTTPAEYEYSYAAQWRLDFAPDAIATSVKNMPASANLGDAQEGVFTMESGLPGDTSVIFTAQVSQNIVNDQTFKTVSADVGAGSSRDVSVRLPSDAVGNNNVLAWTTLQTEVGNIAFRQAPTDYVVINAYNPQIQELQTRINALNLQLLTASAADAAIINAQIAQLEAQQAQVLALNSTVSSLSESLLNQTERATVLAQQITALQQQLLTASAADAAIIQQKIAELNDEATQVSLLTSQLGTLQSEIASLQERLASAVAANSSNALELQQSILALQRQAAVLTQLNNQVSTLQEQLAVARQQNDAARVADLMAQIAALREQQSQVVMKPVKWGLYALIGAAAAVVVLAAWLLRGKSRKRRRWQR